MSAAASYSCSVSRNKHRTDKVHQGEKKTGQLAELLNVILERRSDKERRSRRDGHVLSLMT